MNATITKTLGTLALVTITTLGTVGAVHAAPEPAQTESTRILGTTWELDTNPSVHVTFTRDGEYAHFGCNTARGDIRLKKETKDNGTYRSTPLATTRKLCSDDVMDTEAHVHRILRGNGTWVRSGSTLTISHETGTLRFQARPDGTKQ